MKTRKENIGFTTSRGNNAKQELIHYEFVNSQTGNVIAYLSLPAGMTESKRAVELEKKRAELAVANTIFVELIYWQDQGRPIK